MTAVALHRVGRPRARRQQARPVRAGAVTMRAACAGDVDALHELITVYAADGHLLPRTREEIAAHAGRFIVATDGERILGCADIAPLSREVGEVRSLVIGEHARGLGIGRRLIECLVQRAEAAGLRTLCAFTSAPGFFVQMGFSIVPHGWLPEKIQADCASCPRFRFCGQFAVTLALGDACHR